ncbi:uncharacterized protein AB675_11732 [Cyphellophora attinorum]|uniref:Uncharacterized protein n=1 Tax=Cyphellophora attinorum TaxID=1664694 RepID=A0A0N1H3K1_9EURO|nr:uncharacterized protein AB675_11732 [Phialophora attinorum]KPI35434.1 hypothetical protein AB675_11732 [Phialophora attinorum]
MADKYRPRFDVNDRTRTIQDKEEYSKTYANLLRAYNGLRLHQQVLPQGDGEHPWAVWVLQLLVEEEKNRIPNESDRIAVASGTEEEQVRNGLRLIAAQLHYLELEWPGRQTQRVRDMSKEPTKESPNPWKTVPKTAEPVEENEFRDRIFDMGMYELRAQEDRLTRQIEESNGAEAGVVKKLRGLRYVVRQLMEQRKQVDDEQGLVWSVEDLDLVPQGTTGGALGGETAENWSDYDLDDDVDEGDAETDDDAGDLKHDDNDTNKSNKAVNSDNGGNGLEDNDDDSDKEDGGVDVKAVDLMKSEDTARIKEDDDESTLVDELSDAKAEQATVVEDYYESDAPQTILFEAAGEGVRVSIAGALPDGANGSATQELGGTGDESEQTTSNGTSNMDDKKLSEATFGEVAGALGKLTVDNDDEDAASLGSASWSEFAHREPGKWKGQ